MSSPEIAAVCLLALAVLVGARWLRAWRRQWRHARHVVRAAGLAPVTVGEGDPRFGAMSLTDEPVLNYEWPPFLAAPEEPDWYEVRVPVIPPPGQPWERQEPTAAEVAASRAAHGYIPELDTDPGPGGEERSPGPACPRCGVAHREPHCADGREWGPWPPDRYVLEVDRLPRMGPASLERLADTGDIRDAALLADAAAFMRDQDAEVADWLAGRAIVWARLEIGALA